MWQVGLGGAQGSQAEAGRQAAALAGPLQPMVVPSISGGKKVLDLVGGRGCAPSGLAGGVHVVPGRKESRLSITWGALR